MFIPPGEIIHESLATSYVLVDALVADLCEGGFSGVVEVVLRDTDCFVVISNGIVSAAVEKSGDGLANSGTTTTTTYSRTTVERLARRSRLERGRVSIYRYPAATAGAVAGRINAQPLYVGLSTEFTDLEKMISKLVREREREWFIDVNTETGALALIHMHDDDCRIINWTGRTESGALDLASNPALRLLIDECNRAGGTFDVYFTQAAAQSFDRLEQAPRERLPVSLPEVDAILNEEPVETRVASLQQSTSRPLTSDELRVQSGQEPLAPDGGESDFERVEHPDASRGALAAAAASQSGFAPAAGPAASGPREDSIEPAEGDLSLVRDELPPASPDAEAMAEIKRLMGEIARAIEEAAQSVGRPDSFAMALRAGQLEIADRFPFLDPFAGEFEYLSGEIVFVGHATAENFVEGLTEALKLAIAAVTRSTAYADRFRSYVSEDLRKLLAREQAEFERSGLEEVIRQLITF